MEEWEQVSICQNDLVISSVLTKQIPPYLQIDNMYLEDQQNPYEFFEQSEGQNDFQTFLSTVALTQKSSSRRPLIIEIARPCLEIEIEQKDKQFKFHSPHSMAQYYIKPIFDLILSQTDYEIKKRKFNVKQFKGQKLSLTLNQIQKIKSLDIQIKNKQLTYNNLRAFYGYGKCHERPFIQQTDSDRIRLLSLRYYESPQSVIDRMNKNTTMKNKLITVAMGHKGWEYVVNPEKCYGK